MIALTAMLIKMLNCNRALDMLSDLDCLLCDEVSDPRPLEALIGRPLTPLDDALAAAVRE